MLENPTDSSSTSNVPTVKRYAPPNQRNRSLGRRKSGDRLERVSHFVNDGEKNQAHASRNVPHMEHGDAGNTIRVNEIHRSGSIPLRGCCSSEAFQLLNDRWAAAMNAYNSPSIDLAEKPVLYSGTGVSAWGSFRLPHEVMAPKVGSGPQMDFLSQLRHAMRNADTRSDI